MFQPMRVALGGVCSVALLIALPALAADAPPGGGGHMPGGGTSGGEHRPQGQLHTPPRGFRNAPPDFHPGAGGHAPSVGGGATPHAPAGGSPPGGHGIFSGLGRHAAPPGGPTGPGRFAQGRPGHDLGLFNGHGYRRFTPAERDQWRGGQWRHERHNGYLGWWWVVAGQWFFYPAPVYPFPMYVGPNYYYDYYQYYPQPSYYWYWCDDPEGYYPEVQTCNVPWQALPPGDD